MKLRYRVRSCMLYALLLSVLLILSSCNTQPVQPEKSPPKNLLIITLDTLRADHLSCYGYPRGVSPTLDKLSRNSMTVINAICAAPFTNPSHASIFTSLYPWQHGCRTNYAPLNNSIETIASLLKRNGYHTGAFVSGSPLVSKVCGLNIGFDTYNDEMTKSVFKQRKKIVALNMKPAESNGKKGKGVTVPYSRRPGNLTVEKAINWVESTDSPWFMWVHLYDIHGPYQPLTPLTHLFSNDKWDPGAVLLSDVWIPDYQKKPGARLNSYINRYDACIYTADHYLEHLLLALDRFQFNSNTLIAVLSDHGESLGENNYGFDHGKYLYQSSLHIPIMIHDPDSPGALSQEFMSEVDLAPLILQKLGCLTEKQLSTSSIKPRPSGQRFAETKPVHPKEQHHRLFTIFNGRMKYIYSDQENCSELYNLDEDPKEQHQISPISEQQQRFFRHAIQTEILIHKSVKSKTTIPASERAALKALGYVEEDTSANNPTDPDASRKAQNE